MIKNVSLLAIILLSGSAQAGSWVSSGGELFKDAHNPWFLRNTTQVNYCIQVASSISQPKKQIQESVLQAISFWKAEFKRFYSNSPIQRGSFLLGTQEFREVDCTSA